MPIFRLRVRSRSLARELSASLKPKSDANTLFIGIGFDEKFLKPFVDGKFFAGKFSADKF
jgi:hypothetical protein